MNRHNKYRGLLTAICAILVVTLIALVIFSFNKFETELAAANAELIAAKNDIETLNANHAAKYEQSQNDLADALAQVAQLQSELSTANTVIESLDGTMYKVNFAVTDAEIDLIAKTVWGEARGSSIFEQSAVVWCILNRVDSGRGTIAEVITEYDQFHGYRPSNPVTETQRAIAEDVIARWLLEKYTCGDVGRTLPQEYKYFRSKSDGRGNVFRTAWTGDYEVWDWDCWNPYE